MELDPVAALVQAPIVSSRFFVSVKAVTSMLLGSPSDLQKLFMLLITNPVEAKASAAAYSSTLTDNEAQLSISDSNAVKLTDAFLTAYAAMKEVAFIFLQNDIMGQSEVDSYLKNVHFYFERKNDEWVLDTREAFDLLTHSASLSVKFGIEQAYASEISSNNLKVFQNLGLAIMNCAVGNSELAAPVASLGNMEAKLTTLLQKAALLRQDPITDNLPCLAPHHHARLGLIALSAAMSHEKEDKGSPRLGLLDNVIKEAGIPEGTAVSEAVYTLVQKVRNEHVLVHALPTAPDLCFMCAAGATYMQQGQWESAIGYYHLCRTRPEGLDGTCSKSESLFSDACSQLLKCDTGVDLQNLISALEDMIKIQSQLVEEDHQNHNRAFADTSSPQYQEWLLQPERNALLDPVMAAHALRLIHAAAGSFIADALALVEAASLNLQLGTGAVNEELMAKQASLREQVERWDIALSSMFTAGRLTVIQGTIPMNPGLFPFKEHLRVAVTAGTRKGQPLFLNIHDFASATWRARVRALRDTMACLRKVVWNFPDPLVILRRLGSVVNPRPRESTTSTGAGAKDSTQPMKRGREDYQDEQERRSAPHSWGPRFSQPPPPPPRLSFPSSPHGSQDHQQRGCSIPPPPPRSLHSSPMVSRLPPPPPPPYSNNQRSESVPTPNSVNPRQIVENAQYNKLLHALNAFGTTDQERHSSLITAARDLCFPYRSVQYPTAYLAHQLLLRLSFNAAALLTLLDPLNPQRTAQLLQHLSSLPAQPPLAHEPGGNYH